MVDSDHVSLIGYWNGNGQDHSLYAQPDRQIRIGYRRFLENSKQGEAFDTDQSRKSRSRKAINEIFQLNPLQSALVCVQKSALLPIHQWDECSIQRHAFVEHETASVIA